MPTTLSGAAAVRRRFATCLTAMALAFAPVAAAAPPATPETPSAPAPPAEAVAPDDVLVRLGDDVLTREAFEREFEIAARATAMQQGLEPTPDVLASFDPFRGMLLEQLATQMVLAWHAQELGVAATDVEVDEVVERVRTAQGDDAAAFGSYLEAAGFADESALRALVQRSLSVQNVIDRLSAEIDVDDAEVEAWYEAHPEQLQGPQGPIPLEAVRAEIVALLVRERVDERVQELVAQAPLEVHAERL